MWIFNSSIGKKFIMSITGLFLIIFLTVHGTINLFAVLDAINGLPNSEDQGLYNMACHFMGTNMVVQLMVPVLALGFLVHIAYSIVLTQQNLRARGNSRYAVRGHINGVSWASKNMFALGIIVLGLLGWHLTHFWAKMQLQEWIGEESAEGFALVATTFANKWVVIGYLVWIAAVWFHLSHGFWSAFQTLGINNKIWFKRWQVIGIIVITLIMLTFIIVAVYFGFIYDAGQGIAEIPTTSVG